MSKLRWLSTGALAVALTMGGLAQADPAKIAPGEGGPSDNAFRAFGKFAESWMSEMKQRELRSRQAPTIESQAGRSFATYTGYAPEWDVEVHATGDGASPYVGVLHYEEQLYTCRDKTTRRCSVSRSTPVTEVFPYRDGRWKY